VYFYGESGDTPNHVGFRVYYRFSRGLRIAAIDMPERMRTFDLVASPHQIKNDFHSAIFASLR